MNASFEYMNTVWAQAYGALSWFSAQTYSSTNTPSQMQLVQQSLTNGSDTIGTSNFILSINSQISDLQTVLGLPVNFGATSAVIQNRLTALQSLFSGLQNILPEAPFSPATTYLNNSTPSVPFSDYLGYYSAFSGELNSSYGVSGILSNVASWASAANILAGFYGSNPTKLLDTVQIISSACTEVSNVIYNFASGLTSSALSLQYLYNQSYSLPATFIAANANSLALGLISNQQSIIARNALLSFSSAFQQAIMASEGPTIQAPIQTTTVLGNETLQDVAARTLGNFELWEQIAAINNIIPGTNVTAGTQLFLPPISAPNQTAVSYAVNVLGRDLNIGPTNETMPPWSGDFQTILGTNNLIFALGRRLQTTLGDLVFHQNYGSRIPPEVGSVQTVQTAGQIAAFGKSCLLSDPRVSSVSNVTVSSGQSLQEILFQATVIPIGPNQTPVQVNEVLRPV